MKRWGIVSRALFLGLTPAAVIAVILASYFVSSRMDDLQNSLEQRGAVVARQLAYTSEQPISTGNLATLQSLAEAAIREADISAVTITRADGKVVALSGVQDHVAPTPTSAKTLSFRSSIPHGQTKDFIKSGDGDGVLGTVEVRVSTASTLHAKNQMLTHGVGITLLGLALTAILALRMSRYITYPIQKLAETVKELSRGNLGARVTIGAPGELQALEEGINTMAAALQSAQAHLDKRIQEVKAGLALQAGSEARALTSQKEAAEAANRAKSRFLAAATHDLRQPLHALGLFSGALLEKIRYPDVRNLVVNINKSVESLDGLFNSLLDISKLDAGVIEPNRAAFALQTLFDKLTRDYQQQAQQKGITFRIRPCSYVVYSDATLIERIMRNLISNAVAYTDQKGVLVGARKRGDQVRIEVWDCGRGIAQANLKDIFEEFYQLGNLERDRSKGLGLGLAIVSRLARLLDSEVTVRSAPPKGSVFSFEIPLTLIEPQPQLSYSTPALNNLIGAFIVLIDDEHAVLEGMRALLTDWGCRLILADSIESALTQLKTADAVPDLLIADYRLRDDATGIEALARLQTEYGAGIPGILITGDTSPDRLREAKASGYYILHKPVRAPKLRTLLSYALEQYKKALKEE